MEIRSCRVTLDDMEGVTHTVDVTASTLYEANVLALKALRSGEWVEGIAEGLNNVRNRVIRSGYTHGQHERLPRAGR
jgi:hypothetical protein